MMWQRNPSQNKKVVGDIRLAASQPPLRLTGPACATTYRHILDARAGRVNTLVADRHIPLRAINWAAARVLLFLGTVPATAAIRAEIA